MKKLLLFVFFLLSPSFGQYKAGGVIGAGAATAASLPIINPTQSPFNCGGNGINDDTSCFQSAIDSLSPNGGTIQCSNGATFLLNTSNQFSGGNFNLVTSTDNLVIQNCYLLQGPTGWGSTGNITALLGVFNSQFFHAGQGGGNNGYQSTVANTGLYALSAVAAGATSITFSTPSQAGNFSAGNWIPIATSNTQSGIVPTEFNQVTSVNTSTGVVGLRWPQKVAMSTPYAIAGATGMTRKDIRILNCTLQGAEPFYINDLIGFTVRDSLILIDATNAGGASIHPMAGNATQYALFDNDTYKIIPVGTTGVTNTWAIGNNTNNMTILGGDYEVPSLGTIEYSENVIITKARFTLSSTTPFTIASYDADIEGNTINTTYSGSTNCVEDYNTAPNPYSWPFGHVRFHNNTFNCPGTGVGLMVFEPDTQAIGNTITVAASSAPAIFLQPNAIPATFVINDNTLNCGAAGGFGCLYIHAQTQDGGSIMGNTVQGSGTYGVLVADPGSPSTGTMNVINTVQGFSTNVYATCSNHPSSVIIDATHSCLPTSVTP